MSKKFKHIIKNAKKVSLSKEERSEIRFILENHITENPLLNGSGSFVTSKNTFFEKISSIEWMGGYLNNSKFAQPLSFALIVMFLLGGTTFAAETALPGDLLYKVKILNEKLSIKLVSSIEAKVRLQSRHTLSRLKEAEALESKGKLDEKTEAKVASIFKEHSNDTIASIALLQKEDKEKAEQTSLMFKENLALHRNILDDVLEKESVGENSPTEDIGPQVMMMQARVIESKTESLRDVVDEVIVSLDDALSPKEALTGEETRLDNQDIKNMTVIATSSHQIFSTSSLKASTSSESESMDDLDKNLSKIKEEKKGTSNKTEEENADPDTNFSSMKKTKAIQE
jgi:hypothetical protein